MRGDDFVVASEVRGQSRERPRRFVGAVGRLPWRRTRGRRFSATAAQLSAFGLAASPLAHGAPAARPPSSAQRRADARFALVALGGVVLAAYALAAATAIGRAPVAGAIVLSAKPIGLLDAACAADVLVVALLALTLRAGLGRALAPATHCALGLAVVSLALVLSGLVVPSAIAVVGPGGTVRYVFFCHLL